MFTTTFPWMFTLVAPLLWLTALWIVISPQSTKKIMYYLLGVLFGIVASFYILFPTTLNVVLQSVIMIGLVLFVSLHALMLFIDHQVVVRNRYAPSYFQPITALSRYSTRAQSVPSPLFLLIGFSIATIAYVPTPSHLYVPSASILIVFQQALYALLVTAMVGAFAWACKTIHNLLVRTSDTSEPSLYRLTVSSSFIILTMWILLLLHMYFY